MYKERKLRCRSSVQAMVTIIGCLLFMLGCEERVSNRTETVRILKSSNQRSSLGFSLNDVLLDAATSTPFKWKAIDKGLSYTGAVPDTETTIDMTFAYDKGEIKEVVVKCNDAEAFSGTDICRSRIETKATQQLNTTDGALNEEFQASILAFGSDHLRWSTKLDPQNLKGNLKLTTSDASQVILDVYGEQRDQEGNGGIVVEIVGSKKKSGQGTTLEGQIFTLAKWPISP